MLSCTLRRLDDLQDHLEPLRGADSALLRSNNFDTRLDELHAIRVDLARLPGVGHELARVSGALELLLGLLLEADTHKPDCANLHCLLSLLARGLNQAEETLEQVI